MATSKIDKEPQAEQDPFHEILQRMESHFTSQGDLLENLNQQLQKVIADGVGHWPSQGSDESVEAPRASPLVLHDEPLQPEHPIERSSERAKLQQNRHSMDSKESKISLGLDSNMTHEPHQAQQRRSEEHGISSVATFVTQEIRRQERVARQAARKLTEQKLSSINAAMYWSQRPKEENFAHRIINSWWFVNGISSVIVINMILLGVEVDLAASIGQENVPVWYGVVNATAVGIFVIELSLTFLAIGIRKFFCGKNRAWNIFDFCIISLSLLETSTELWQQAIAREQVSTSQLRFFRSVRLVRALRGVRMVRLLRYVGALRTLVLSIASSMASLFWTLVLLVLIFYTFGIMFTQLVSDYCRYEVGSATMAGCVDKVGVYWSSLPESMLTLFMTISGGVNWGETFRPLIDISIFAVMCHIIFTTIAVLAVEESSPRSPRSLFCLATCAAGSTSVHAIAAAAASAIYKILQVNVVTGVFCTTAMESAAADKEIATMKQLKKKNAQLEDLRNAFEEIVDAESNTVNIGDFEKAMRSDKFRHFLESMSISTEDISTLFTIMDSDQSGLIDLEEFVQGCLQLHGPAKSLQLAKMSFENKITRQAMKSMATSLMEVRAQLDRMSRKALLPRKRRSQLRQPVCSI